MVIFRIQIKNNFLPPILSFLEAALLVKKLKFVTFMCGVKGYFLILVLSFCHVGPRENEL